MTKYQALESTFYFYFAANDTSGSGDDGASAAAHVRLAGASASAAPVLSPTPSLLEHATFPAGCYEVAVAATTANGFSASNWYAVFCTLAVDSQNPTGFIGDFYLGNVQAETRAFLSTLDLTSTMKASVNTEADSALSDYDPPTHAELVSEINDVQTDIGNLNNVSTTDLATAIANYDPPTHAELISEINDVQTDIAGLNNISTADLASALATYDGPTYDELLSFFQLVARFDSAIKTDRATALSAINANQGSGTGDYDPTTESLEGARAQRNTLAASSGGSSAYIPNSRTITTGTESSGTIANLANADGLTWQITDVGNIISVVVDFVLPPDAVANRVQLELRINSSNDSISIEPYDWVAADYDATDTVVVVGTNGTTNTRVDRVLISKYTGTGANAGQVRFRLSGTGLSTATLIVDQFVIMAVTTVRSVGYAGGFIWIDTNDGVNGATSFVHGVADNPINSLTNFITLDTALGLKRAFLRNNSLITLSQDFAGYTFDGDGWILNLGAREVDSCVFRKATIVSSTGTVSASTVAAVFQDCLFGPDATVTMDSLIAFDCGVIALTFGSVGNYSFINCQSAVPGGSAPIVDCNSVAVNAEFRRWSGGLTLNNVVAGSVISIDCISGGTITINGTGGTVHVRGMVRVVDGSSGTVSIITTQVVNKDTIGDAVLVRDWTAVTGEAGRSMLNALRALRNKTARAGSVLTVYEEDDTTEAWTATLTTSAGDPITEVDPD